MSPDEQQFYQDVLCNLPLKWKLTVLVSNLLMDDAEMTIENLIDVALIMTKRLPAAQRASVVWALNDAAETLGAKWN